MKYYFVQYRLYQQHFTGFTCLVSIGDFTTTRILILTTKFDKTIDKETGDQNDFENYAHFTGTWTGLSERFAQPKPLVTIPYP
jgi:hypothetical protein